MSKDIVDPLEALLEDVEIAPISPMGIFAPETNFAVEPIPEANEENLVCLRGPCRHYLQIEQRFNHGNTIGTLHDRVVQINRYCLRHHSTIDLTDECVYACNEWDPIDLNEPQFYERDLRRKKYLETKAKKED